MIYVIATIELVDGRREEFLKRFHELVPAVQAEEGCIEYGSTIDVETGFDVQGPARSNVVTIVEKWDDVNALKRHLAASHMVEYRNTVKGLVEKVSLQILEPA